MTEEDQPDSFLPKQPIQDELFVEIPAQQMPPDRIPSSFDPMEEIELRGRASSRFASGQVPWWILIAGWSLFGMLAFVIAHVAIASAFRAGWLLFAIATVLLLILLRGTIAKLTVRRHRSGK